MNKAIIQKAGLFDLLYCSNYQGQFLIEKKVLCKAVGIGAKEKRKAYLKKHCITIDNALVELSSNVNLHRGGNGVTFFAVSNESCSSFFCNAKEVEGFSLENALRLIEWLDGLSIVQKDSISCYDSLKSLLALQEKMEAYEKGEGLLIEEDATDSDSVVGFEIQTSHIIEDGFLKLESEDQEGGGNLPLPFEEESLEGEKWTNEQVQRLLDDVENFEKGLSEEEKTAISSQLDVPVLELPENIAQVKNELSAKSGRLNRKEKKAQQLIERHLHSTMYEKFDYMGAVISYCVPFVQILNASVQALGIYCLLHYALTFTYPNTLFSFWLIPILALMVFLEVVRRQSIVKESKYHILFEASKEEAYKIYSEKAGSFATVFKRLNILLSVTAAIMLFFVLSSGIVMEDAKRKELGLLEDKKDSLILASNLYYDNLAKSVEGKIMMQIDSSGAYGLEVLGMVQELESEVKRIEGFRAWRDLAHRSRERGKLPKLKGEVAQKKQAWAKFVGEKSVYLSDTLASLVKVKKAEAESIEAKFLAERDKIDVSADSALSRSYFQSFVICLLFLIMLIIIEVYVINKLYYQYGEWIGRVCGCCEKA